ncbi:MAG: ABC transporter ATP-binding protein [Candidatus Xenobia bacterium]
MSLLSVRDLRVTFPTEHGPVQAVRGVSLEVAEGETLGIVGETGCGKSVLSLAVLGLLRNARVEGNIRFQEQDLSGLTEAQWEDVRGRRLSMVFQDPATALNPVFTIGDQLASVLVRHGFPASQAAGWMERVGLLPEMLARYPHQLSGGQRQRVAIALALAAEPSLVFADEPTTALDVTVQAQVLRLLSSLAREVSVSVVLISHDLDVIAEVCRRMAVMYAGRIVEEGPVEGIFKAPRHPYTRGLFAALPREGGRLESIPGSVPSPHDFPTGCPFHPRCSRADDRCKETVPVLEDGVACHHPC